MVDWDSPQSQDVVLRRKFESGEEVAVSALLGPFSSDTFEREDSLYPRDVLMKVCVKKPSLSSMLQFDCKIYELDNCGSELDGGSEFDIKKIYYRQSPAHIGPLLYKGPSFRLVRFAFTVYQRRPMVKINCFITTFGGFLWRKT